LISGLFSCWYFLQLKQLFFLYYFSHQVMAILWCVAQKAASAAQPSLANFGKRSLPLQRRQFKSPFSIFLLWFSSH
jgi:hypothetical protein